LSAGQRLDVALDRGTEHQRVLALRDWLLEVLLVRPEISPDVARERANNASTQLMDLLDGRLL
jgi:hypothetical protein